MYTVTLETMLFRYDASLNCLNWKTREWNVGNFIINLILTRVFTVNFLLNMNYTIYNTFRLGS